MQNLAEKFRKVVYISMNVLYFERCIRHQSKRFALFVLLDWCFGGVTWCHNFSEYSKYSCCRPSHRIRTASHTARIWRFLCFQGMVRTFVKNKALWNEPGINDKKLKMIENLSRSSASNSSTTMQQCSTLRFSKTLFRVTRQTGPTLNKGTRKYDGKVAQRVVATTSSLFRWKIFGILKFSKVWNFEILKFENRI